MKLSFSFRMLSGCLLALALFNRANAQAHDATPGVPVRVWGSANGGANPNPAVVTVSSADTFLADGSGSSTPFPVSGSRAAAGNAWFDTAVTTAHMEPGKVYRILVDGVNAGTVVNSVALNMAAPLGYEIEIDYQRRQRAVHDSASRLFTVRLLGAREQAFMAAGAATQLMVGRIYWQVGLGALRNGKAAGSISIVDAGSSSDWSALFTISALHYETPSPEITIVPKSGGLMRQIVANQSVLDIVTRTEDAALSSTQYELRFYHPLQASGSGLNVRTFTGQPYLTYRVEQGATATTLRITSTTRNTSAANGWTAPVARTAVTSLARTGTGWPNFTWTRSDWNTQGQAQVAEQVTTSGGTIADRTDTLAVRPGGGGASASHFSRTYRQFAWGEEIVSSTAGSANGMTTTYDYYNNSAEVGRHGFLKSTSTAGGGWEAYDYWDATSSVGTPRIGTLRYRYRPFKNAPLSAGFNPTQGEVTNYDFAQDPFGVATRPTLVETRVDNVLTAKSSTAYTDEPGPIPGTTVVRADRTDHAGATGTLLTTTRFFREDTADLFYRNQVHSVTRPDNVKVSFAYQRGSFDASTRAFTANPSGLASRIATITGTTGSGYTTYDGYDIDDLSLVPGKSTLEVVIRDDRALVRRTETHAWVAGAWALVGWVNYDYDTLGHLVSRVAHNGATYTCEYNGEQKTAEVDEQGVRAEFEYDAAGRLWKVKKRTADNLAFTTTVTYAYDAAGRITSETVSATGTTETVANSRTFDDAGRVTSVTPAGLGATLHGYDVANRSHTVTTPDGATRTQTYFRDGRLEKLEGTGVVPSYFHYAIEPDGRRLTQVNTGTAGSPRHEKSWSDWLGRPVRNELPGFSPSAQPVFVTENFYDDATTGPGRLSRTTRSGLAPVLYQYDPLGMVIRSGADLGGNGALDLASSDRLSERDQFVESFGGALWLRAEARIYPTAGSSSPITAMVSRVRLTGHGAGVIAESQETDIEGDTSTSTVSINRAQKTVTTTTTVPGLPTAEAATLVNGLATSFTTSDGLTYTSEYDALERLWKQKQPRHTGPTTYAYKPGTGMLESVTDPAGHVVAFHSYDSMGRIASSRNADNRHTRLAYNARGQVVRRWGDAAYPVEIGYDPTYGQQTTMSTFRTAPAGDSTTWPSVGTADVTTWTYDPATGLLSRKTDAANKSVEFDYNARGQLKTRRWARKLVNTPTVAVTTTYRYYGDEPGQPLTGELWQQNYNDEGELIPTPDLTYTYDRLGRVLTIDEKSTEGGVGVRTFAYDPTKPWRLFNETLPAFFGSRVLTRLYDETTSANSGTLGSFTTGTLRGRAAGFEIGIAANPDRDLRHTRSFSNQPRLAGVSAALNEGIASSFTYAYKANSTLLDGYSGGPGNAFTVSRDYEANRDLVTRLEAKYGSAAGNTLTRFEYTYDPLRRRTTAKQSSTAFAAYTAGQTYSAVYNVYAYNARGELQSAAMYRGDTPSASPSAADELPGRRFEYRYDSIGNRRSSGPAGSSNGGIDSTGAGDNDYAANALNQYTARENNRVEVAGTAAANANVAVLGTMSTARKDRAWANSLEPDNASAPAAGQTTVFAAVPGSPPVVRTENPLWVIPKRAQAFTYDDDGNLTGDGMWTYTYNAENQLVRMTSALASGFGSALGHVRKRLDFKYDYAGRRIEKRVANLDTSSELLARRFVYDGWNLVLELDGAGSAIQRSYTWGLDAGGNLGSVSSPGSLLQLTNYSGGAPGASYFPTYDDQGNVISLVKASDGALAAVYEYDPFGNLVRNEVLDSAVADNPFRHATKYHDGETGLVYYGHRYYDPSNGRFINKDPIGESGGLNLYGFIGNAGVNGHDVLGLTAEYVEYEVWEMHPGSTIVDGSGSGRVETHVPALARRVIRIFLNLLGGQNRWDQDGAVLMDPYYVNGAPLSETEGRGSHDAIGDYNRDSAGAALAGGGGAGGAQSYTGGGGGSGGEASTASNPETSQVERIAQDGTVILKPFEVTATRVPPSSAPDAVNAASGNFITDTFLNAGTFRDAGELYRNLQNEAHLGWKIGGYVVLGVGVTAGIVDAASNFTGVKGLAKAGLKKIAGMFTREAAERVAGKTVLGHSPEYTKLAGELGARRFNIPTNVWNKMTDAERWAANQKFLDRMINRGDDIILATPLDKVKPGSYFQRELDYLFGKGYKVSPDGTRLVPGGG